MDTYTKKIREIAKDLLASQKVDRVIGFEMGTIPMAARPVSIESENDAEKLVFNSLCAMNLANYIRKPKGTIAVIAKGCDSRNMVNHVVEHQVDRENLVIIGVPCHGMIDKSQLALEVEGEITAYDEEGQTLKITTAQGELTFEKQDFLKDNCRLCQHRNPVIHDYMAGDPVTEQELEDPFADVNEIEAMSQEAKSTLFEDLTKNCIRCYACRNACPLCFCPTCFVDESSPQWVGKSQNKTDVDTFHFLRAFHCAGRCTDCGACVEACPMDIDVRKFTRKLIKDSYEMFGWEAGLDISKRPPLDTFNPADPDDFIM